MYPPDDDGQPAPQGKPDTAPTRRPGAHTVLLPGPLRSLNFRLLAACNVISVAGSQAAAVAIPFAVLRSGGSASDVGYVATAELIAMIGCLLLGGAIADRLPRHHVIIASEALQALSEGAAAALVLAGHAHVWQLTAFYRTGRNAAAIGGAALGGLITGLAGPDGPWRPTPQASPQPRRSALACASRACRPRTRGACSVTSVKAGANSRRTAGCGPSSPSSRSLPASTPLR
jgi:hypothetical protein